MKIRHPNWFYWGSEKLTRESEKRKILATNVCVLLGWSTMTFYGFFYLLSGNTALIKAAIWYIPFYIINGLVLWLNKIGKSYLASCTYALSLTIAITTEVLVAHGVQTGIHYYLILFALVPTMIFNLRQWITIIVIFVLNISTFFILEYLCIAPQQAIYDLSQDFISALRSTFQFTCAITLLFIVVFTEYSAGVSENRLELMSATDWLTGIPNRLKFDSALANEWNRARRSQQSLAVAIIDVDWFKKYNDHYGHQKGDDCLRVIAGLLSDSIRRSGDIVARYGGEEFAFIAPNTNQQNVYVLAEVICNTIRNMELPHEQSEFGFVTVSIGVASTIPCADATIEDLIGRADSALYEAKRKGRCQVEMG